MIHTNRIQSMPAAHGAFSAELFAF